MTLTGNDSNPVGKAWRSYGKLNSIRLAPGDTVLIAPGEQEETLKPSGEGTAEKPVVIKFQPGVHTIHIKNVLRKQLFISNSIDSTEPIPVGVMLSQVKHFRLQGGGVDGPGKTTLLYEGRMMQILNENSQDIDYSGLVLDLKRPARVDRGGSNRSESHGSGGSQDQDRIRQWRERSEARLSISIPQYQAGDGWRAYHAIEKLSEQQLVLRFVHPQTYGFVPYAVGDEIAVSLIIAVCPRFWSRAMP